MIEQHVEMAGLDHVNSGLATIGGELDKLKPFWELLGDEVRAEETQLFAEAPWTPLSETYAEQKAREFGDKPTLRATDVLYKSLTQENAPGNVNRITDQGAEFGSSNPLAKIHQAGGGNLPARQVLVTLPVNKAVTLAGEHLLEIVAKAGFN